ncbi:hypothetical protein ACEPAG_3121 [Sanghuangporus baumii]
MPKSSSQSNSVVNQSSAMLNPSYPNEDNLTCVSPSSSYCTAETSFGGSSPASPVIQAGETDLDTGREPPTACINTLACVSPAILSELTHLDLSRSVIFNEKKVVAGGSYGDICTGSCRILKRGRIKVAIKRLRFWCKDDIETLFTREIYVWSKLNHRNILPLLGYAIDKSTGFPMLISEWMENGSAWNFVTRHPDCDIMHPLVGTASGLNYLHSLGIIHSDIKSDNIMISETGDALICDFGCTRMVVASRSFANLTSGIHGTSRYIAYELLVPLDPSDEVPTVHSMKTDVWAFGMTMYELCTLRRPYANLRETQVAYAIGKRNLPQFPTSSPLSGISRKMYDEIEKLCHGCWKHEPTERSSMSSILAELRRIRRPTRSPGLELSESFSPSDIITESMAFASNDKVFSCEEITRQLLLDNPDSAYLRGDGQVHVFTAHGDPGVFLTADDAKPYRQSLPLSRLTGYG